MRVWEDQIYICPRNGVILEFGCVFRFQMGFCDVDCVDSLIQKEV